MLHGAEEGPSVSGYTVAVPAADNGVPLCSGSVLAKKDGHDKMKVLQLKFLLVLKNPLKSHWLELFFLL